MIKTMTSTIVAVMIAGTIIISPSNAAGNSTVLNRIKAKGLDVKIVMVKDHAQGWLTVETGRADAYASDDAPAYSLHIIRSRILLRNNLLWHSKRKTRAVVPTRELQYGFEIEIDAVAMMGDI